MAPFRSYKCESGESGLTDDWLSRQLGGLFQLTCRVWGRDVQCHSRVYTPGLRQSQRSTCGPYLQATDPCSSVRQRSRLLKCDSILEGHTDALAAILNHEPTFHILHNKTQVFLRLKWGIQCDNEGIICKYQDVSLSEYLLHLIPQHQVGLQ